jgi:SagB-type dehydrogenase family enzyme
VNEPDLETLRPLLAGPHRREGDAVVIAVGRRDVRVGGDAALAEAILGACDGRRTLPELAAEVAPGEEDAVRELLGELLRQEAVVDCTQAYRLAHRHGSVGSPFLPELDDEGLRALGEERFQPPETSGEAVDLAPAETSLGDLASRRRSAEAAGAPRRVTFEELSALLSTAYGGDRRRGRPVASAGGLYPLVLHVWAREALGPLAPGLWWYDPAAERLRAVPAPEAEAGELFLSHPLSDALLVRGHPVVFVSADLARMSRKYGNRGYRYGLMEAGAVMQSAYLSAAELDLPIRAIGGIHDDNTRAFLALPDGAEPLLALLLGA